MTATTPRFAELAAPANWRVVDFISDLHLQADDPATAQAWHDYLMRTSADAVFMLGDLFEVWVGDDGLATAATDRSQAFEQSCVSALRTASQRRALYVLHGNRDFLLGPAFAQASGLTLLDDPTVFAFAGRRWLLSHGDALCLDDEDYLRFRAQVRSLPWQQSFLAQPLAQRREIARQLRGESESRKRGTATYADVDADMARAWLHAAGAHALIHGHTHRPAAHDLGHGLQRLVLSDWDMAATPPRADVLRLRMSGPEVHAQRLHPEEAS